MEVKRSKRCHLRLILYTVIVMPAWVAPALAFGASALSGFLGFKDNEKARKEQSKQNALDRQFQLDMWNRTNAFNHPMQQMLRLKAAGLNPNLVYGNGADVTASNQQMPQSRPLPHPNAGQMIGSTLETMVDIGMKEMQKDLMAIEIANKTQNIAESQIRGAKMSGVDTNKVIADTYATYQNISKSKAEMVGMGITQERDMFELGKAKELRQNSMDVANESLRNIQLRNAEQELINAQMPEKHKVAMLDAWSRMKLAESTMSRQAVEIQMQKEALQLRQQGIETNDHIFFRLFNDWLTPDKPKKYNGVPEWVRQRDSVMSRHIHSKN